MNIRTKIKQVHTFTTTEKVFVEYLLEHPQEIIQLDIHELSKKSYVSTSTIYRVIEKLDLSGFNQLKMQVAQYLTNYKTPTANVDYNYPFEKNNTHHQIFEKLISLYEQTLKSTFNLIDLDEVLKIVQQLDKAKRIVLFPSIGNYFMAESFQQNMLEIGVNVEVIVDRYYQSWHSTSLHKGDVVIVISYAGRTPHLLEIIKTLYENEVTVILISSTAKLEISKYAHYHLYFSSYEDSEEKIASFSSRISLQYLLDGIYACFFNRNFEKHLHTKIDNYLD